MKFYYGYDMPTLIKEADTTMQEVDRSDKPLHVRVERLDMFAGTLEGAIQVLRALGWEQEKSQLSAKMQDIASQKRSLRSTQQDTEPE